MTHMQNGKWCIDKLAHAPYTSAIVPKITTMAPPESSRKESVTMVRRGLIMVATAALALVLAAGTARAVDAPKWVAALYVQAQKTVGLRWTPVPGATEFRVLRSTAAGKDYKQVGTSAQPQFLDKELEPGTTYYYVLQAATGAEVSPNSEERSVAIPGEKKVVGVEPPVWDTVTLDQATQFGKTTYKVVLVWRANPGAVVAYNLYRSETAGKDYQLVGSSAETRLVDDKIEEGKTYYYALTALDGSFQETPHSVEKSVAVKKTEKGPAKKEKLQVFLKPSKLLYRVANEIKTPGGPIPIEQCADVVVNEKLGRAYFTNWGARAVMVVEAATGKFLFAIRRSGPEPAAFAIENDKDFRNPQGLGLDEEGNLYVVDKERYEVAIFDEDGKFLRSIELKNDLWEGTPKDKTPSATPARSPLYQDVAVHNGEVFVTDSANGKVLVFNDRGALQHAFGKWGKAPEEMLSPSYIVVGADGNLLIVDAGQVNVRTYSPAGEQLSEFGEKGQAVGTLFAPTGITALEDGGMVVTSGLSPNVQKFEKDGKFGWLIASEDGKSGLEASSIRGIYVDKKQRFYMTGATTNQLAVFQLLEGTIKRD